MKSTQLCLALLLTSLSTSLFAGSVSKVIVSTNSINVFNSSGVSTNTTIKLGGQKLTWHLVVGKTNLVANLPNGLSAGTYSLIIGSQAPFDVTVGVQGLIGPQGLQGIPGINGTNGLDGAQGIQGLPGINGTNGLDGAQGIQGIPGINGTNGLDGINGTNGLDGINGTNGLDGINGTNGLDGAQGPEGPAGGLVGYLYAFTAGTQTVANNGNIVFSYGGANTGGANSWSTNGSTFTIPTNGVYQVAFHISGAQSGHTFGIDIVDSPNSFVQSGIDPAYFQFEKSSSVLEGQVIVNCSSGDQISIENISGFSFSLGNNVSTNLASANLSIIQLH